MESAERMARAWGRVECSLVDNGERSTILLGMWTVSLQQAIVPFTDALAHRLDIRWQITVEPDPSGRIGFSMQRVPRCPSSG